MISELIVCLCVRIVGETMRLSLFAKMIVCHTLLPKNKFAFPKFANP